MATQTRRTTRRSARFFSATVKASMVTVCCGLVLWSAVATYAELPLNGLPMNGLPINGMPMNGLPTQGGISNGIVVNAPTLPAVPQESLPWNGLSQWPLGMSTP